jgi:hypothetical protein
MANFNLWPSGIAKFIRQFNHSRSLSQSNSRNGSIYPIGLLTTSLSAGWITALIMPAPAQAQSFSDILSTYWAKDFIEQLASRNIITGFPDGTFRPDDPVTRAQFAAMVQKAFNQQPVRKAIAFIDVPAGYWAYDAIQKSYTLGFISGYPTGTFYPDRNISRTQVLVSLTNGLNYFNHTSIASTLQFYSDADTIPPYARSNIAAATEKQLVVNYPNRQFLNPEREATRAEVAAFLYQALVSTGAVTPITSPYIVAQATPSTLSPIAVQRPTANVSQPSTPNSATPPASTPPAPTTIVRIPTRTTLPTRYPTAHKIYLSQEEPEPVPVTLLIDRDIISPGGALLIPRNSQVVGELRLVQGGAQFYAKELVLTSGTHISMNATSRVIATLQELRPQSDINALMNGAMFGTGAAGAITAITGNRMISSNQVLGGLSFDGLVGFFRGRDRLLLITINPDADLDITLNSPLSLSE